MEKLTHFKKLRNPNYIGSYELMIDETTSIEMNVTIEKVVSELVQNGDKKEEAVVAYLKGHKPMIMNATNLKATSKALGTDFIEHWVGKEITLYVKKIRAFGEMVDALRVKTFTGKKKLPELVKDSANFNKCKEAIKGSYTIEQIKAKYNVSPETEKALLS